MNFIYWKHFFPCVLIVLDIIAAGRYAMDHDWGRTSYWIFAAGITASATFWIAK